MNGQRIAPASDPITFRDLETRTAIHDLSDVDHQCAAQELVESEEAR